MVQEHERTPHERETLIFPTPDEAKGWLERVGERITREERKGVRRRRELLGEELAEEFDRQGEGVRVISHPWDHTREEHAEVQRLVDVAFARDLPAALRIARSSDYYPRNIDLFHDVLTTEMYDLLREHKLNRQPVSTGVLISAVILTVVASVLLWVLTS
ncbi:MAG: hypothetical protein AAB538_06295 [Patescibacteria group bacterium]